MIGLANTAMAGDILVIGSGVLLYASAVPLEADSQDPPDIDSAGTFPGGSQTACQDPPLASGCRGTFPGGSRSSVGTWPRGPQVVRIIIPGDLNRSPDVGLLDTTWGWDSPLGVLDTYSRGLSYWDSGLL